MSNWRICYKYISLIMNTEICITQFLKYNAPRDGARETETNTSPVSRTTTRGAWLYKIHPLRNVANGINEKKSI